MNHGQLKLNCLAPMVEFLSIMWIIVALLDLVPFFFLAYLTMMLSNMYATKATCQVGGSSMAHLAPT